MTDGNESSLQHLLLDIGNFLLKKYFFGIIVITLWTYRYYVFNSITGSSEIRYKNNYLYSFNVLSPDLYLVSE